MAKNKNEELEGTTLDVYLYVIKKGAPAGPRDVMKAVNLSSPSVAYRHLQKLEDLNYLKKNEYGEYEAKSKVSIKGYTWIGSRLIPKMWNYAFVFAGIMIVEVYVLFIHFLHETYEFKIFFLLLILVTGLALSVFVIEGFLQKKRITNHRSNET